MISPNPDVSPNTSWSCYSWPNLRDQASRARRSIGPRDSRDLVTAVRRQPHGFSLVEMLVALVVLSLSLSVLYQAATGATRNSRVAAEYTEAVMLAESVLAEHSYISEENYSASGGFGDYRWLVTSWPALYENANASDDGALLPMPLQYLEVAVSWPGGSSPRTLELITVVPLQQVLP